MGIFMVAAVGQQPAVVGSTKKEEPPFDIGPARKAIVAAVNNALTIGRGGKLPDGVAQGKAHLEAVAETTRVAESA